MTLNRAALRELVADAIAARRKGYNEARDALHRLQREISPEAMLDLLDDAARVRPEPESIHPPPPVMLRVDTEKARAALQKLRNEIGAIVDCDDIEKARAELQELRKLGSLEVCDDKEDHS